MELNDSQPFFHFRHWLRDGGIRYLFDSFFLAACMALISSFFTIVFVYFLVTTIRHQKQTVQHVPAHFSVIDHRKDGTFKKESTP